MSRPVVRIQSLSLVYPPAVAALDGIDLEIPGAGITALTGANGSGKTTLLRILSGRLRPSRGSVTILGVDAVSCPERLRSRIGHASQELALDPEMTGQETLDLFASLYRIPRRRRPALIAGLTEKFALAEHSRRRVSAYSGGLRRRLHLAVAWIHDPELLLLDEPSAALDPRGRAQFWEMLCSHAEKGGAAVIATHDLAEAERHCARAVILERGRILANASPQEIRDRHATSRITLRLERPTDDPELLIGRLKTLEGVRTVHCSRQEITAETAPEADLHGVVARVLSGIGREITRLKLSRADLSSAYFNLTGHRPAGSDKDQGRAGEKGEGP